VVFSRVKLLDTIQRADRVEDKKRKYLSKTGKLLFSTYQVTSSVEEMIVYECFISAHKLNNFHF